MKIETVEQLISMPIGSEIYKVENNDVRKYTICCHHPSPHLESVLISYGTNEGCSKWVSKIYVECGKMFTEHNEAVSFLIDQMERDLDYVKQHYYDDSPTTQMSK